MGGYYNTTNESGEQLKQFRDSAEDQNTVILQLFKRYKKLSPSDVYNIAFGLSTPLTSVRRSITNLTNEGFLVKLEEKKIGPFGRPEHLWVYRGATEAQLKLDV